jgi:hypothetical protein
MCPEFLLAILYFTILFLVNSFLWKVLQSYTQKIKFVEKIKKISSLKLEKKPLLSFLLSPFKKEKNLEKACQFLWWAMMTGKSMERAQES